MKKTVFAMVAAAAAMFATPALADDFTGPRVAATVGYGTVDKADAPTFGAQVGWDAAVGGAVFGLTGEYLETAKAGRDLSVTGRVGTRIGETSLVYALGGYTNRDDRYTELNRDGYRFGVGLETATARLGANGFAGVEYRYSSYEPRGLAGRPDSHQVQVMAGVRF